MTNKRNTTGALLIGLGAAIMAYALIQSVGKKEAAVSKSHYECVKGKCVEIQTEGTSTCNKNSQCNLYPPVGVPTFKACVGGKCVDVEGDDPNECVVDGQCVEVHPYIKTVWWGQEGDEIIIAVGCKNDDGKKINVRFALYAATGELIVREPLFNWFGVEAGQEFGWNVSSKWNPLWDINDLGNMMTIRVFREDVGADKPVDEWTDQLF